MHKFIILFVSFFILSANAQFRFEDLDEKDVEKIIKDITSLSSHTSVSGAHNLDGDEYAFEIGAMGSYAQTPDIDKFVTSSGGEDEYEYLPMASILARLGVAELLTIEALFLPEIDVGEYSVSARSLAVQLHLFNFGDFALGVKAYRGNAEISYEQLVDSMAVDVEIDDSFSGWQALLGHNFGALKLYLGYGVINFDGEMDTSGDATIFDVTLSSASSVEVDGSSNHYFGGLEYTFKKVALGLEAAKLFNNERFSAKVTFLNIF